MTTKTTTIAQADGMCLNCFSLFVLFIVAVLSDNLQSHCAWWWWWRCWWKENRWLWIFSRCNNSDVAITTEAHKSSTHEFSSTGERCEPISTSETNDVYLYLPKILMHHGNCVSWAMEWQSHEWSWLRISVRLRHAFHNPFVPIFFDSSWHFHSISQHSVMKCWMLPSVA